MEPTVSQAPKKEKIAQAAKAVTKNLQAGTRYLVMRIAGLVLALVFLSLSFLFLAYSFSSGVSSAKGVEGKVVTISSAALGKCRATSAWGGLFKLGVEMEEGRTGRVYVLYPALPESLNPALGDLLKVWPANKPKLGAPAVQDWGWFLLGVLTILGFVFLEFGFLSLRLR